MATVDSNALLGRVMVPDEKTLEEVVAIILRNRLLAGWTLALPKPGTSVAVDLAVDSIPDSWLGRILRGRPGFPVDLAVITAGEQTTGSSNRECLVLPDAAVLQPVDPGVVITRLAWGILRGVWWWFPDQAPLAGEPATTTRSTCRHTID